MEMEDPRRAGRLKERALKDSEKLKRNFQKIQRKADELIVREELEIEQNIKRMQIEGIIIKLVKHQFEVKHHFVLFFCIFTSTSQVTTTQMFPMTSIAIIITQERVFLK